ncbi:2-succinyl-6-hydroxy-2,4-cyclohexadiene-1-carboxylate synthase [Sporolactobacillus terrae]|uniref:Putative 2-succinyl-6-hydroxy-2,4-cyclohexadiene-1-carboxylate synthase n=1 Tax=Sporolactobacillus terrae TaxID=269673 RepID=A0A5K7X1N1_9BACL|nr:2-succinyl-6-hydroxy-2,4-cyclohexadiene-1-carboxylate synthase [Sporolactobacillus terrae]BBN98828.1 putative 2-succinyl-6-hydroxy-2,4-cyclohexadiene-1-carboxylate synthase [Sporolactobacillus terrae]
MKINLRGVHYHYEQTGLGTPVLLLHGFTGSSTTWHFLEKEAAEQKIRLITVDIIGHGLTECPERPNRYAITEAAKDLAALLDVLKLDAVHLVGYSMGGRLALSFSCMFPKRVRTLTLESASPGLKTEMERQKRRDRDVHLAERIKKYGLLSFVNDWENIPLFASQKDLPKNVRSSLRDQRLASSAHGLVCSLIGMGTGVQPSWWTQLTTLHVPTFLITGARDRKFCTLASEMKQALPCAEWYIVPNAGHAVHLEKPDPFKNALVSFIHRFSASSEEGRA